MIHNRIKKSIPNQIQHQMKKRLIPALIHGQTRIQFGHSAPNRDTLLYIDPTDISYILSPPFCKQLCIYATHIIDGEWDLDKVDNRLYLSNWRERDKFDGTVCILAENYEFLRSARRHFHENIPWEETLIYKWMVKNRFDLWEKYKSVEKIQQTLSEVDALYDKMVDTGYQTQRRLQEDDSKPFSSTSKDPPEIDEIMVNIGRNGQLIFDEGRHRWVVARLAGVNQIPVRVLVRHEQWQRRRKELAYAESILDLSQTARQYIDHPDMQDVAPNMQATVK